MKSMTEVVTNLVPDNQLRTHHGLVRRDRGWVRPAARRPHHVCRQPAVLSPRQARIFADFPDLGGPVAPVLSCLRRANHRGSHLAEGVEAVHDELAFWLEWGEFFWRIFPARSCGPRSEHVAFTIPELDVCSLPRRHRGDHTTQYVPVDVTRLDQVRFELDGYGHRPATSHRG